MPHRAIGADARGPGQSKGTHRHQRDSGGQRQSEREVHAREAHPDWCGEAGSHPGEENGELVMKRRLILLNLVLLVAIAVAGNALRDRYLAAKAHEQQVLKQKPPLVPPPQIPDTPKTPPVAAATYADVAQKMLFTRDRNPNVIVEPPKVPPPKVMPPLPFAYGVMDFGSGPIVLLAEKAGGQNKSYHPGDKIGEFKIASVSSRDITFEWDGKEIK